MRWAYAADASYPISGAILLSCMELFPALPDSTVVLLPLLATARLENCCEGNLFWVWCENDNDSTVSCLMTTGVTDPLCRRPSSAKERKVYIRMDRWNLGATSSRLEHIQIAAMLDINGLVQDCSNSSASALELLQSCTKPLIYFPSFIFLKKKKFCYFFYVSLKWYLWVWVLASTGWGSHLAPNKVNYFHTKKNYKIQ